MGLLRQNTYREKLNCFHKIKKYSILAKNFKLNLQTAFKKTFILSIENQQFA